jgi:hypothetical protein
MVTEAARSANLRYATDTERRDLSCFRANVLEKTRKG